MNFLLLSLGAGISMAALLPMIYFQLKQDRFFLSPFLMVGVIVYVSVIVKLIFMFSFPDANYVASTLLAGYPNEVLFGGLGIFTVFVGLYVITASLFTQGCGRAVRAFDHLFSLYAGFGKDPRVYLRISYFLFAVALVAFALYIWQEGIEITFGELSRKRFISKGDFGASRLDQSGYYLFKLSFLARASLVFSLLALSLGARSKGVNAFIIVVFVFNVFLALFFSMRVELLFIFADVFALFVAFRFLRVKGVIVFLLILLLLYVSFSFLRGGEEYLDPFYSLLGRRYLSGIDKLSLVYAYYQEHELLHGKGMFSILDVFVSGDRFFFELPNFSAFYIFEANSGGIPLGGVAEGYMNYGFWGVGYVALFFSFVVTICSAFVGYSKNSFFVLLFFFISVRFVFLFFNTSIFSAIVKIGLDLGLIFLVIPLGVFFEILRRRKCFIS